MVVANDRYNRGRCPIPEKPVWRSKQMSNKTTIKPLAIAVGTVFITTLASATATNATENPFAMTELSNGYMVADAAEGKCGEGKCGGEKKAAESTGKMEEGKCGGEKKAVDAESADKTKEGKCGEGKCGGSK